MKPIACKVNDKTYDDLKDITENSDISISEWVRGLIEDEFEFTCSGYHPNNPLYDLMKTNGYMVKTGSDTVNDLNVNPQTWEDHPSFNYGQN